MKLHQAGQLLPSGEVSKNSKIRLPVTILAGFLGSGKTTLLNNLLRADHGLRIAVMVNDFGAINVDSSLVVSQTDTVISLSNGCICCNVQIDLVGAIEGVLQGAGSYDHILIESSGVSDPARIAQVLFYPDLKKQLFLNATIGLVDISQFEALDDDSRYLAHSQLDAADIILMNKCDLSTPEERQAFQREWLSAKARILETEYGQLDWQILLEEGLAAGSHSEAIKVGANASDLFESDRFSCQVASDLEKFKLAVAALPVALLRAKGFLSLKGYEAQPILFQLVGSRVSYEKLPSWPEGIEHHTQIVLIGRKGQIDFSAIKSALKETSLP